MVWARLSETFFFFRQHLLALFWLLAPVLVPVSLFLSYRFHVVHAGDVAKAMGDGLALGLQMVAGVYANALVIRFTLAHLSRAPLPSHGQLWQEAMSRVPGLFVVQLLAGMLVFAGLLLFILPGIWLLGVLMPACVLVVAEPLSGVEALKAAWTRFRPGAWPIAASLSVLLLGLLIVMSGFSALELALQAQPVLMRWLVSALLEVIGLLCAQTAVILLVRFYDLERTAREGEA